MKALLNRILRGRFASRLLKASGVNPVHYWLLVDLFGRLSERSEFMTQLGRSGFALKTMAWLYLFLSALASLLVPSRPSPALYLSIFLGMTAMLLLALLISETNNSLVNPEEGLVLAHQPIDGATYTAAKLSHLARILLYMVPALNAVPALAGLALRGVPWFYPFLHLGAAFAVGLLMGLFSCALFGWLIRFVPAPSLKTVGKWTELIVWMSFIWLPQSYRLLPRLRSSFLLTMPEWLQVVLAVVAVVVIAASLILGLRSLSVDYMLRVSSIVHGSSSAGSRPRRRRKASAVSGWFGGQPGRAAFKFVASMMPREWHFIRQVVSIVPLLIFYSIWMAQDVRVSPFSGHFSRWHIFPHIFGLMFYIICSVISYGNNYKGSWIFLLAPAGALKRFARGVVGLLWMGLVVVPNLFVLVFLVWLWGAVSAVIFVAYSLAVASFYLGLMLRLIEGVPFTRQPQVSGNYMMLPMLMAASVVMAGAVALQYFFVFRSVAAVLATTAGVAAAAWFLTRSSLDRLAGTMRYTLGLVSGESSFLYKEIIT
jgi:hypothetical protein